MTAQTSEWSQGMNKTSNIIDPTSGNITVQSPGVRQGFEKLSAWVDNNLIDANDLSAISVDSYGPPNQYDNSIEKFAKGNAVFMRHWSTVAATLKSRNLPFRWGILPVLGHTSGMNVGALGGWNVGVYRFANNPSGAVKVVKWMTSRQSQRDMVVNGNIPVFSARADLYRGFFFSLFYLCFNDKITIIIIVTIITVLKITIIIIIMPFLFRYFRWKLLQC